MNELVNKVADVLIEQEVMVVTVESCTGGFLAKVLTDRPGSSAYFEAGYVTYANRAKVSLGVDASLIEKYGAVSLEVAQAMAKAVAKKDIIALSTTGIAGPDGGSALKPVGTVCFGLATQETSFSEQQFFSGDRKAVRQQSVRHALIMLLSFLTQKKP